MIAPTPTLPITVVRRFILGKQGLWPGRRWTGPVGTEHTMRGVEHLQLDPWIVIARSQDLMLHSRVIDYQPDLWAELAYQQRKFFDWGGCLAARPMDELPHWRVLMRRERIDLRNNAGGSFEQAILLAERFLPSGVPLAVYEGREGRAKLYATGTAEPRQERLTLVINGQTASSAELFAGILQWHHRAELVGSPTVGKRTVQRVARLDQQHLLFLTTGRFLAPNGSPFGLKGLTPDRAFEGDDVGSLMAPCPDTPSTGP